jgi:hypothetical protein
MSDEQIPVPPGTVPVDITDVDFPTPQFGTINEASVQELATRVALERAHALALLETINQKDQQIAALREQRDALRAKIERKTAVTVANEIANGTAKASRQVGNAERA